MNSEAVRNYVEQSRSLLEASPQMDEENTKVKLVHPFIELLDWDFYSTEVELEHTVQMGTQQSKVDYALKVGDTPVVFIEAKPARSELTKSDIAQLRSYMRQELAVDWGVLTNGKEFEILSKSRQGRSGEEISIATFDLDELATNPDLLEILTKDAIQSGRADEIANQIAQTNRAIRLLQEQKEDISEQLTDILQNEIGEVPIELEDQSLEFVEELRDTLREQRQFIGESTDTSEGDAERNLTQESRMEDDGKGPFDTSGRYVVTFSKDGDEIAALSGHNQSDAMAEATDYLIQNHNLIDNLEDIPWVPGRSKAIINDSNEWDEADPVYHELESGYFLDTKLNEHRKKRELRRMAERCRLSVDFSGEW